jgi:hypothetical protein
MKLRTITDLRPGDIGFGPIKGGAGLLVGIGQMMLLEGFHVGPLSIRHVFVVTGNPGEGTVQIAEAMPDGARAVWMEIGGNGLNADRWTNEYAYVRLPEDYPGQAGDAAAIARAMIGTPYSFASYAALAAWRLGIKTRRLEAWIDRRKPTITMGLRRSSQAQIALPAEAICSVLADQAWSLTGKKIMQGVAHQCVTPGALARRLLTYPGAEWIWPGIS